MIPFPNEEVTPPKTKTNFVFIVYNGFSEAAKIVHFFFIFASVLIILSMQNPPVAEHLSASFRPTGHEVDPNKRLRLTAYMQKTQEVAEAHAALYRCGFHELIEQNTVWVLSRMVVEIGRMPLWDEPVELVSWHKRVERIFALRDFILYDAAQIPIVKATSAWLLMDIHTRRMLRVEHVLPQLAQVNIPRDAIAAIPEKLGVPEKECLSLVHTHRVGYSDLDLINHVTNTKYVEWTLNCLPFESLNRNALSSFQINFNLEAKHDDVVELWHATPHKNAHYVEGRRNGQNLFQSVCLMKE